MACYNSDYAIEMLRQSIDLAEIEHGFSPLRKWANEVERSCHGLEAIEARLNRPTGQDFLLIILQSVAAGVLSPEEASRTHLPLAQQWPKTRSGFKDRKTVPVRLGS